MWLLDPRARLDLQSRPHGMTEGTSQGEAGLSEQCSAVAHGKPRHRAQPLLDALNSSIPSLERGGGRDGERRDAIWVRAAMRKDSQENSNLDCRTFVLFFSRCS